MEETRIYDSTIFKQALIGDVIKEVVDILSERGYNPINQIVGYLMSGDPGYISSYKECRNRILEFKREDIIELMLINFINKK